MFIKIEIGIVIHVFLCFIYKTMLEIIEELVEKQLLYIIIEHKAGGCDSFPGPGNLSSRRAVV